MQQLKLLEETAKTASEIGIDNTVKALQLLRVNGTGKLLLQVRVVIDTVCKHFHINRKLLKKANKSISNNKHSALLVITHLLANMLHLPHATIGECVEREEATINDYSIELNKLNQTHKSDKILLDAIDVLTNDLNQKLNELA